MKNDFFPDDAIYNENFNISWKALEKYLGNDEVDAATMTEILKLNKVVIGEFSYSSIPISKEGLEILEEYINKNLEDKDKLFVSDLIDFANNESLDIPIEKCFELIKKNENHFVVISSIDYLYTNFDFSFIKQFYSILEEVIDNNEYHQTAMILASFYLFRFSHNSKYCNILEELLSQDDFNVEVLKNILWYTYNSEPFFILPDRIMKFIIEL